jgi:hypothetical protein
VPIHHASNVDAEERCTSCRFPGAKTRPMRVMT